MASIGVPHLVMRPGPRGGLPRYFWQPSPSLRARGFRGKRVPSRWASIRDPEQLFNAAVAEAMEQNRWVATKRAAWRIDPLAGAIDGGLPRTVDRLMDEYRQSDEYKQLRYKTKRGYEQCLTRISSWAGDAPVAAIDYAQIQTLRRTMAGTPAYLNAVLRVLRVVLTHAMQIGWTMNNAASHVMTERIERSGLIWPAEAVDAFVAIADAMGRHSIGTAVLLNSWIGQRQGDVLRLTRAVYREGSLLIKQSKTGAKVKLPVDRVPALQARLEEEAARVDALPGVVRLTHIIVDEKNRRYYSEDQFRHVFSAVRAAVAKQYPSFDVDFILPGRDAADPEACRVQMKDLTFMHLRHTAVVRLAEAGCDDTLIAAVTGHALTNIAKILSHYLVRTRHQAELAFEKRLAAEETPKVQKGLLPRLFRVVGKSTGA